MKIVEAFAFWICQNAQKEKVKKYRVETSLIRYLNDTEIYIWPEKWLYNSDRDLKLQEIMRTTNIALAYASRQMLQYRIHHTQPQVINYIMYIKGAKSDWDFRISDLVKNPDGTDI